MYRRPMSELQCGHDARGLRGPDPPPSGDGVRAQTADPGKATARLEQRAGNAGSGLSLRPRADEDRKKIDVGERLRAEN